jgi:hypothetical protein
MALLVARTASAGAVVEESVGSPPVSSSPAQTPPANLLSDQFTVGAVSGSPATPRSGFLSDRLLGTTGLTSSMGLIYGVAVTRDLGAPAAVGSRFPDRGGTILRLSAGDEWQVSPRWALISSLNGSPSSTTRTSTTLPFQDGAGMPTNLAGDLQVKSSSMGGEISAEFDTLDAWGAELVVTTTGGLTTYWSTQKLLKLQLANDSVVNQATLAQQCQTEGCSADVRSLLGKQSPSVLQGYVDVDVTAIIRRTQLGLSGTAFAYSSDPSQLGSFGVAAFARGPTLGDGVALAPLRWSSQAHITHKLGRARVAGTGEYGQYVEGEGSTVSISAKPAYDLTARVRLWATGTWQRDSLTGLGTADTLVAALGLRWAY